MKWSVHYFLSVIKGNIQQLNDAQLKCSVDYFVSVIKGNI